MQNLELKIIQTWQTAWKRPMTQNCQTPNTCQTNGSGHSNYPNLSNISKVQKMKKHSKTVEQSKPTNAIQKVTVQNGHKARSGQTAQNWLALKLIICLEITTETEKQSNFGKQPIIGWSRTFRQFKHDFWLETSMFQNCLIAQNY